MRFTKSLMALGAINSVVAHTTFTTLYVDGVSQGDGTCIRMNQTPNEATYPVQDLTSNDMACGISGETGVSRVCAANQSSTLTFQFRNYTDGSEPGVIAPSHLGPCAVYLKQVSSAINDPGYGDGWFKIWESGYDEENEEWCVTKLINAGGFLSVDLPSDLAGGYYLARTELLALHNAADLGDPQFYTGCAQLFLDSDATTVPTDTVSIPGYVTIDDPSVTYNIYATPLSLPYPIPGPAVYEDGVASNIVGKRAVMEQTEGLKPEGCILEVANWCGLELDTYSDSAGCWNSSTACWSEDTSCYADAGPTGSAILCPIWEDHCTSIQNACNTSDFNGPPNAGTNLQPAPATIDLALVSPSGVTSAVDSSATSVSAISLVSSALPTSSKLAVFSASLNSSASPTPSASLASSAVPMSSAIPLSFSFPNSSVIPAASSSNNLTTTLMSTLSTTSTITIWETKTATGNPTSSVPPLSLSTVSVIPIEASTQCGSQVTETTTVYGTTISITVMESMTQGGGSTLTPGSASELVGAISTSASSPPSEPSSSKAPLSAVTDAVTESGAGNGTAIASPPAEETVTVTLSKCPNETETASNQTGKRNAAGHSHQRMHEKRKAVEERWELSELGDVGV